MSANVVSSEEAPHFMTAEGRKKFDLLCDTLATACVGHYKTKNQCVLNFGLYAKKGQLMKELRGRGTSCDEAINNLWGLIGRECTAPNALLVIDHPATAENDWTPSQTAYSVEATSGGLKFTRLFKDKKETSPLFRFKNPSRGPLLSTNAVHAQPA